MVLLEDISEESKLALGYFLGSRVYQQDVRGFKVKINEFGVFRGYLAILLNKNEILYSNPRLLHRASQLRNYFREQGVGEFTLHPVLRIRK